MNAVFVLLMALNADPSFEPTSPSDRAAYATALTGVEPLEATRIYSEFTQRHYECFVETGFACPWEAGEKEEVEQAMEWFRASKFVKEVYARPSRHLWRDLDCAYTDQHLMTCKPKADDSSP